MVREAGASKDGPEIGLLTWACHNIWLEYRYSMDKEILKKLFPILKRSVNYYLHFLKEEDLPILRNTAAPRIAILICRC